LATSLFFFLIFS